jgi:predicted ABC-type ATPase
LQHWFWLIAGPNGVGKTTYAMRYLRSVLGTVHFLSLDEIARGLSPLEPRAADRAAGRVALTRARELMRQPATFAMETTLAGRTHLGLVEEARSAGLAFGLLYFAVPQVETCLARIARRVVEGGHDVPEADARRRFVRSAANFPTYAAKADRWRLLDNGGPRPVGVAEGTDRRAEFVDEERLAALPAGLGVVRDWRPLNP